MEITWWFQYLEMPGIVSLLCVLMVRLMGRTEEKCPTLSDKLQMGFIYLLCWASVFLVLLLFMAEQEAYMLHKLGIQEDSLPLIKLFLRR
ncbi:MAG: hypothetical protein J6I84_04490 [Bacilli bacterium]|nr:hypothetical protein [Bacilli bacterium]